jgi:hypothetical protein
VNIYVLQVVFMLVIPIWSGFIQLVRNHGIVDGLGQLGSHSFTLVVLQLLQLLNTSYFWRVGVSQRYYSRLAPFKVDVSHRSIKTMFKEFYRSHWRDGFFMMWLGIVTFFLSLDFVIFFFMFFAPASIWLWGILALNPGALPTQVSEGQWKKLVNEDTATMNRIMERFYLVPGTFNELNYSSVSRIFFRTAWRLKKICFNLWNFFIRINFAFHKRAVRLVSVVARFWKYVFIDNIPLFVFSDTVHRPWTSDTDREMTLIEPGEKPPSMVSIERPKLDIDRDG